MSHTILIADDYEDNRELLRLMLESEGFDVREARDGREALEIARRDVVNLALIDLSMPTLDGWSTLRELRADEHTRHISCVAVTAFAAMQDRRRAIDSGFDAYISKPYKHKELLDIINGLLAKAGQSQHQA